ncbi:MAG: hypothetical protein RIQ52_1621 [Pseudomonadota bacterium]|jgi:GTP-binding protein
MNFPPVSITFLQSVLKLEEAPVDSGIEIAFAGRSNAGKSSAINTLALRRNLARTSKTPGRTQVLNFFSIDEERRFVDLPGYGYAKVSGETQARWIEALEHYMTMRQSLRGVFLLMDIRHPFMPADRQMLDWCDYRGIAVHIALTKCDKLSRGASLKVLQQAKSMLAREWPQLESSVQLFSSLKRSGVDEAWELLADWLKLQLPEEKDSGT